MQIKRVRIRNFRCLRDVTISLGPTTVLVGVNSAGKTAIMEAIKIALSRRWGMRGTGFNEYDFYSDDEATAGPAPDSEISIELHFAEDSPGDWPEDVTADLTEILSTDPLTGLNSISLRVTCGYDATTKTIEPAWVFLGQDMKPLVGRAAKAVNLSRFFEYVPVFGLSALRDVDQEFSARSSLWSQLLKRIQIPAAEWEAIESSLGDINKQILSADPRLEGIKSKIQDVRNVVATGAAGAVDIRALPLKAWDLIERAEVVVRGASYGPWLPLERHGQGVQSLSIIYLFQAFVDQLLGEMYPKGAEPLLLLEEPEAHLHPQAARALGKEVTAISGQKIISTHSPYFLERMPLTAIRLVRLDAKGSKVHEVKRRFQCELPKDLPDAATSFPAVAGVAAKNAALLAFSVPSGILESNGAIPEKVYRELLVCSTDAASMAVLHPLLKQFKTDCDSHIPQGALDGLEEWARRMRGEIFFARRWLLCEGQCEYVLFRALFESVGRPPDQHGVSIIDFQNNGNSASFASLARSLGFPWLLTCDGDAAGDGFVTKLRTEANFTQAEIEERVHQLPKGTDLEAFLVGNGFKPRIMAVAAQLGDSAAPGISDADLSELMRKRKTDYAAALAGNLLSAPIAMADLPVLFQSIINQSVA